MATYEPGVPPVQVTWNPRVLSMFAAVAGLVQVSSGLAMFTVAVKGPTSAPPEPWKVNVPPEATAPEASWAKNAPLMPNWEVSVVLRLPGPESVIVPTSRPVNEGTATGCGIMHPPGETELGGVYDSPR